MDIACWLTATEPNLFFFSFSLWPMCLVVKSEARESVRVFILLPVVQVSRAIQDLIQHSSFKLHEAEVHCYARWNIVAADAPQRLQ